MCVFIVEFKHLVYELFHFCFFFPALGFPVVPENSQIKTFSLLAKHARFLYVLHFLENQIVFVYGKLVSNKRGFTDINLLLCLRGINLLFFYNIVLINKHIFTFKLFGWPRLWGIKVFMLIVRLKDNRLCFAFYDFLLDFRADRVYSRTGVFTTGWPFDLFCVQSDWFCLLILLTRLKRRYLKRLIS